MQLRSQAAAVWRRLLSSTSGYLTSAGARLTVFKEDANIVILSQAGPYFEMNQLLIGCKSTGQAAIIDAGCDPKPFIDTAAEKDLTINDVYQTHAHSKFPISPDFPLELHINHH